MSNENEEIYVEPEGVDPTQAKERENILGREDHMHDVRQWKTFTETRYKILRKVVLL